MCNTAHTKIALVTGANRGIGEEIAKALAQKGFHVLIGARKQDLGEATVVELSDHGNVSCQQLDTTDPASVTAAAEAVESKFGHLDLLVSQAYKTINSVNLICIFVHINRSLDSLRFSCPTLHCTRRVVSVPQLVAGNGQSFD